MKQYVRTLTIAGSDSGGGAGIQADLKTFFALGCYGMSAMTAVTAQNTRGVKTVCPLSPSFIKEQIECVLSDLGADAIKIGLLYDTPTIQIVSHLLKKHSAIPIVLDPVMIAKGGASLLLSDALPALKQLLPQALLLTPNLEEASALLGRKISLREEMADAARDLLSLGAQNVLLKGGHLKKEKGCDCFVAASGEPLWFERPAIETKNTHGTGCTYSAAIAAFLARGFSLVDAIGEAKSFLHASLEAGAAYSIGSGHGPLCLFHAFERNPCAY